MRFGPATVVQDRELPVVSPDVDASIGSTWGHTIRRAHERFVTTGPGIGDRALRLVGWAVKVRQDAGLGPRRPSYAAPSESACRTDRSRSRHAEPSGSPSL